MNNALPTLTTLAERHPSYFDRTSCFFCNQQQETLDHIITCDALTDKWNDILNSAITKATQKARTKWDCNISTTAIKKHITKCNFITNTCENKIAWVKGFLPNEFSSVIRKKIKGRNKTLTLAHWIHKSIIKKFKQGIWSERCELYKRWMDTKSMPYHQYCHSHRTNNINKRRTIQHIHHSRLTQDPSRDDDDDLDTYMGTMGDTIGSTQKKQAKLNKQDWSTQRTNSTITNIAAGIRHTWTASNDSIKKIVRSRRPQPPQQHPQIPIRPTGRLQ
jgi:hypothetical protein